MTHRVRLGRLAPALALMLIACSQSASPTRTPGASATPPFAAGSSAPIPGPSASAASGVGTLSPTSSPGPWTEDLDRLDNLVRNDHVNPFAIHTEAEWSARLSEVAASIGEAGPNEQLVLLASLVGLLDTHSSLAARAGGWHFYGLLPYRFADGWFVIRATDASIVGTHLVSIGGVPIDEVVRRMTPLVPHDNPTGLVEGLLWYLNSVEFLDGTGVATDTSHPHFGLERPDGTSLVVDPPILDESHYLLVPNGWLQGDAPEAVARRNERIWTRLDDARRTFLIAVNDYGDMTAAADAMTAALDADQVDRVIFDMRYLQGGNGDIKILDVLINEPHLKGPGALTVLIGRENVSAATQVAFLLDTQTDALLVGEPTPARANNFTCPCSDLTLPNSGFTVSVPLHQDYTGDDRPEVAPDVPMSLSSADFFAGRDPVLEAALAGLLPTPTP